MFYRDKTKFCSESFCKDLQTDLDNYFSHQLTLSNENFNELFNNFVHIISHSIDTHAPLRPISRRMRKLLQKLLPKAYKLQLRKRDGCLNLIF